MRSLVVLLLMSVASADVMPPPPTAEDAPPAQPAPDSEGEAERPLAPPPRPAVAPEAIAGCATRSALPLALAALLALVVAQRGVRREAGV